MKLSIISGRSGSGKSTALRALEDAGFNCLDNFPVNLLDALVASTRWSDGSSEDVDYAVCIDSRNQTLDRFPEILAK